jgi:LysR family transcriptional regulator, hydrogen peroxide-inducible genes activator
MEMHQIRYFLAVDRERNFSRAAETCNITQPALTRAIQKLEDEVGGKLFHRRPGRIELTELGRAMLPRLQHAYEEIVQARADALDLVRNRKQRLRLGVMCTIGPDRLAAFVKPIMSALPKLELVVTEQKGTAVVDQLLNDGIDIGIVGLPNYPDCIDAVSLYHEQYVVAVPDGHRFAAANSVALRDLHGEDYIERINCEFDQHFDASHGDWPIDLNTRYRSEREDWVQAMIKAGFGIAIMPESMPLMPGIRSAPLIAPDVSRAISAVSLSERELPEAANVFLRLIRSQTWA